MEREYEEYDPYVAPADPGSYEGSRGLSFWDSRGYPSESMFDANGQLNPGWTRTEDGYMNNLPAQGQALTPPTTGGPGATASGGSMTEAQGRAYDASRGLVGGYWDGARWISGTARTTSGGDGGGEFNPYGDLGRAPGMLPYPAFESAGPFAPRHGSFEFDPYQASTWTDAENEPGYKESRLQLRKMIEQGAANKGILRSGMTIGDIYTNLDALGQQNMTQFDNRRYRNWSGNRDLAAQKFGLELGVDRDVYDRRAADIDRGNNYRYNVADSSFKDDLSRWQEKVRSLTSMAKPT